MARNTGLTPEEASCLEGCRTYEQYHRMRRSFESGHCSFCNLDRALNVVRCENDYVMAWSTPDSLQRKGLAHQWLIVPKRHVRAPWDLSAAEWMSVSRAQRWIAEQIDLDGGMLFARFGDMSLNAGTVPHLHWNVWVPDGTTEIRIPVMKDPKSRAENEKRAAEFATRYESGESPE